MNHAKLLEVHEAEVHRAHYFCPCGAMWRADGRCSRYPMHVTREARLAWLDEVKP